MNRAFSYAALIMALFALGCGGSSVTTAPRVLSGSTLTTPAIETVVFVAGSTVNTNAPVVEDPLNIQVGELVEFQVVAYDSAGGRHILPATSWTWSDSANQFGSLNPYNGLFAVGQTPQPTNFIVNAQYNGATVGGYYRVNPFQARVIGKVVGSDTGKGVRGIGITFIAADNSVAGSVTSSYDGTFRASVKTTAVTFSVDPNTVGANYYQSFEYGPLTVALPQGTGGSLTLVTYTDGAIGCDGQAPFQPMYNRGGSQIGSGLVVGENFLFQPAQPSTLLAPVAPANPADPGLIVVNARSSYAAPPTSSGCFE